MLIINLQAKEDKLVVDKSYTLSALLGGNAPAHQCLRDWNNVENFRTNNRSNLPVCNDVVLGRQGAHLFWEGKVPT